MPKKVLINIQHNQQIGQLMERSTDVIQEARVRFVGQFDSEELGLKFATKLCNSFCSEIIPAIDDNSEEATRLLGSTDSDFVDGLLTLISHKQSSNVE